MRSMRFPQKRHPASRPAASTVAPTPPMAGRALSQPRLTATVVAIRVGN